MKPIPVLLPFLGWEFERQARCLIGLAPDTGSPEFTFDSSNPVVRIARIVDDLHFQREGEPIRAWRERQGIEGRFDPNSFAEFADALEGLHVVFELMRSSSKESLLTAHAMKSGAPWRLIRRIARQGQRALGLPGDILETDVVALLASYEWE